MPVASPPALQLKGMSVHRGGGRRVIDRLDCSVEQGSWFGVIGANGSGKTTLLRAVAGRLPIAAGACEIFGENFTADRAGRANRIGFAPPIEFLPQRLTGAKLLELAGDPISAQQERSGKVWDALGLRELLPVAIGNMSSGMRQRIAIGIAFARPNPIVILDEPLNWLDPVAAYDLKAALGELVGKGLTLITALHDTATMCACCNGGMMLSEGQVKVRLDQADLRRGQSKPLEFERAMIASLRSANLD